VFGGTVRIDPVEAGAAYARQASFRRVPQRNGISLQLAADSGSYLRHDRGRLTLGTKAGHPTTTFALS
jgi:hypothetical protein